MNTFGSSAELTTATSAERSLNVNVDDEAQEVDANLDSEDELDKELLTAEIKVRTPSISSASYERSAFAMQPIQLPTLPAELMYTDPHEYVDRMLDSHGEDPRRYWEVPFSRLSPPDVLHIADTLASQGIEAAIDLIEQYSTWVRNWLAQQNYGNDQSSETETRSITSELVSPSDTMVEGSPRRALAGAVGDIPVPLQPQILSALEALSDLEFFALGPAMSTPKFDDTADDAEATPDDTDSVVAWPYGPSRSTTLDNPAVGVAPDGHLGDQFAAMMMQLPARVSAPQSGACTPVGHDIVPPCTDRRVIEFVGLKAEQPRLLSIRSSPRVKATPLHF
ncbi:uncharacterized protein PHACADRAFT_258778 [Phanerochaete carnosa HHB-10118-sp]|uniref:Uncharacterized protein n=1 Tax=Phanerochaete carnosa (strain HHB-10118-sp) TaxID=650164 RepID=K5W6G0_PHACS|nr:uncharacterized protein PHACADRAFT_258778 [Phanerochaete carnosa HHB-10118-sp]EKM54740.1 hypothetical protein PHACADRAFT_258778 [Phanerochaete carnosa HHB-10118-sp]